MKSLGKFTCFAFLLVFGCIYSGYALTLLWGWFVVPTFRLAPLQIPNAIGLAMIVSYLVTQPTKPEKDNNEYLKRMFISALLKPSLGIVLGWIIQRWI